jgi:hypothetical protein
MKLRNTTAACVVLAATTVWSQSATYSSAAPLGAPAHGRMVMAAKSGDSSAAATQGQVAMRQRVQEMGATLGKMHTLLKQMRTKTAAGSKDSMAKANLDMWELMVGDLEKQYEQLRLATVAREELQSRRNALYKQAEEKAALAAKNAQAAGDAQVFPAGVAGQGATQPAPAPSVSTPSTSPSPASPN